MAMERENRPARGGVRKRKKVCQFCVDKCEHIDYKDAAKLRRFISERSKILPRRTTGTCAMHQRQLTEAIKRARQIARLPVELCRGGRLCPPCRWLYDYLRADRVVRPYNRLTIPGASLKAPLVMAAAAAHHIGWLLRQMINF